MCVKGDSGGNLAIFAADIVVNPQHPSHIRRLAQVSKWLSLVNVTALGTDIPRQPEGKDLNLIPGRKVFFFLHWIGKQKHHPVAAGILLWTMKRTIPRMKVPSKEEG